MPVSNSLPLSMVMGSLEKEFAPLGANSFFRIEFQFLKIDRREVLLSKIMQKHYDTVFMIFEKYPFPCCCLSFFFMKSIISGNPTVLFSVMVPFQ